MLLHMLVHVKIYTVTPSQSLDYPTCAESVQIRKTSHFNSNRASNKDSVQFNDHQHENIMKNYYKHKDKMTPNQIRRLKLQTFPYLSSDDVSMLKHV